MIGASARKRTTTMAMAIYLRSPIWLQDTLISAYGLRLLRLRYGRTGRETLARLNESQWMSPADLRSYQLAALTEVVGRAASDVPFYRRRGLDGIDFDSLEQLRVLPLLT